MIVWLVTSKHVNKIRVFASYERAREWVNGSGVYNYVIRSTEVIDG
jgi:hypothetical protein